VAYCGHSNVPAEYAIKEEEVSPTPVECSNHQTEPSKDVEQSVRKLMFLN